MLSRSERKKEEEILTIFIRKREFEISPNHSVRFSCKFLHIKEYLFETRVYFCVTFLLGQISFERGYERQVEINLGATSLTVSQYPHSGCSIKVEHFSFPFIPSHLRSPISADTHMISNFVEYFFYNRRHLGKVFIDQKENSMNDLQGKKETKG